MIWRSILCTLVTIAFMGGGTVTRAADEEAVQLYLDVKQVNTTESLRRISELPIVYYKFLHDTVPDRVQLGAIGPDAQRLFPESIEVLPSATFTNTSALATGGRISTFSVRNFPIVDKTVLFMHGLAALQELISRYDTLQHLISTLSERDKAIYDDIRKAQQTLEEAINHQLATKLKTLELEAKNMEAKLNLESEREEEESRKLKAKLAAEQSLLELEEKLAKERLEQQEKSTRDTIAQQLQLERDIALKKDAMYRENDAKLATARETQRQRLETKRLDYEKEKIRAEIDARTQQERLNEEIQIKKIQLQAKLETERMVQGIKSVSQQVSMMIQRMFAHPEQLLMISGMFLGIVLCYYLIREFSSLVRQWIQQRLGRPVLVRETSYHWSVLPHWLSNLLDSWSSSSSQLSLDKKVQSWSSPKAMEELSKEFEDIILSSEDKERILQLALATRNTKRSAAPYRHVLLHGPPGTGKTLIARRLAECSAMDYAILSGGDVAPLGEDAVNQLHALFAWAQKSRRGLLVFIDEAEAFLCSRTNSVSSYANNNGSSDNAASSSMSTTTSSSVGSQSTHLRNALNALLYQTGTPSRSFMMVLATNRPQDLDAAVLDRVDVSLHIGLPQPPQRQQLIHLYMQIHVTEAVQRAMLSVFTVFWHQVMRRLGLASKAFVAGKQHVKMDSSNLPPEIANFVDKSCFSESAMQEMIDLTDGFSGREISKLFISVQYVLLLSHERKLTWPMLYETVRNKAEEHSLKMAGFNLSSLASATRSVGIKQKDKSNAKSYADDSSSVEEINNHTYDGDFNSDNMNEETPNVTSRSTGASKAKAAGSANPRRSSVGASRASSSRNQSQ